jgi:hypothetical protein
MSTSKISQSKLSLLWKTKNINGFARMTDVKDLEPVSFDVICKDAEQVSNACLCLEWFDVICVLSGVMCC